MEYTGCHNQHFPLARPYIVAVTSTHTINVPQQEGNTGVGATFAAATFAAARGAKTSSNVVHSKNRMPSQRADVVDKGY